MLQLSDPRVDPFDLLPGQKSTAASTVSSKCCSGGSCAPKEAAECAVPAAAVLNKCCSGGSCAPKEAAQCAVPVAKCCGGNKKCG